MSFVSLPGTDRQVDALEAGSHNSDD